MDAAKVAKVKKWPAPESVKGIQTILGFTNFYRRFIHRFSEVVSPLTVLTKKGIEFAWGEAAEAAFQSLKTSFSTALILIHFDPETAIIIETDASDYVPARVLLQHKENGILHPV